MSYRITVLPKAERQISKLPPAVQTRIKAAILALSQNPRPHGVKKLQAQSDAYRVRAGDYRVVYAVDDAARRVYILKVAHRDSIYG